MIKRLGFGFGMGRAVRRGAGAESTPPPEYATVALGIAGVADGERFMAPQDSGWHFEYTRVGSAARFEAPRAVSAGAIAQAATIAARTAAYASLPSTGVVLPTITAAKWGGRMVQNVKSNDAPTLNLIDPSISLRDEDGGTTPAMTVSTATDPLGGTNASRMEFAASTIFMFVDQADYPAWTTPLQMTMSVRAKSADVSPGGPGVVLFGASNRTAGAFSSFTPQAAWTQYQQSIPNYSVATVYDLGLLNPTSGVTYPFAIDVFGVQIHADTGPVVLPSLEAEHAGMLAGHAKAAAGHPGALPVDTDGWITPSSNVPVVVVPLARRTLTEYAIAGWGNFSKANYTGAYAALAALGNTRDTGTTTLQILGSLGMDCNAARYGMVYCGPSYSSVAARAPTSLLDQGPVHLGIRVAGTGTAKTVTLYVNGVPLFDAAETFATATISPEVLFLGGTFNARSRDQSGNTVMDTPDKWADAAFFTSAISDADMSALYMAGKAALAPTQQKLLVIGSFDSLTAFAGAPFFNLWNKGLDGAHFMLDAIGGTKYMADASGTSYSSAARRDLRQRALRYGAEHYDKVIWLCQYGTNDLVGGVMDPNTTTWQAGRDTIDGMISDDILSVPSGVRSKISRVIVTIPPHGEWLQAGAAAANQARNTARIAYNADCVANYAARGYAECINWDSYVPSGFASLAAAATAAFGAGNAVFQSDGIHWNVGAGSGGDAAATSILVPRVTAWLADL